MEHFFHRLCCIIRDGNPPGPPVAVRHSSLVARGVTWRSEYIERFVTSPFDMDRDNMKHSEQLHNKQTQFYCFKCCVPFVLIFILTFLPALQSNWSVRITVLSSSLSFNPILVSPDCFRISRTYALNVTSIKYRWFRFVFNTRYS